MATTEPRIIFLTLPTDGQNKRRKTMIKPCKCTHGYQDQKYGTNKRVWIPNSKGRKCSVCGAMVIDERDKEVMKKRKSRRV